MFSLIFLKPNDRTNHEILMKNLQYITLFINYSQERTQIVKYKKHRSTEMNVTTGVPQGSSPGPRIQIPA